MVLWPCVRARRVGRPSSRSDWRERWRERLCQLIDAMDRSVEELGPDPPERWRRGQLMRLAKAAVAEHVAVQEDISNVAAEPAGDEPAAMMLAMVLAMTSQLSLARGGARRTYRLR